ncbi:MAG: 30S ribosomal protein S5 [Candidatus Diapherotrites archaeon]
MGAPRGGPRRGRDGAESRFNAEEQKRKELEGWVAKTDLGRRVQKGEVASLAQLFEQNAHVMEPEIIDYLVPDLQEKMVDFKKTAKVRRAGRMFRFRVSVLVGDGNGHIGLGMATDKERWPAVRKATRKAKLAMVQVRRGCGSWECTCGTAHSVPFTVEGKSSSVRVLLLPAPSGTGLVVGDNIKDVLRFAGLRDVWSKTKGNTMSTLDFVAAAIDALAQTTRMKGIATEEKR